MGICIHPCIIAEATVSITRAVVAAAAENIVVIVVVVSPLPHRPYLPK